MTADPLAAVLERFGSGHLADHVAVTVEPPGGLVTGLVATQPGAAWAWLAVAALAGAAALLVPSGAPTRGASPRDTRRLPPLPLAVLGLLAAVALLSPRALVMAMVAGVATAGIGALLHLRRCAALAAATADRVRETCEALADDLAAGASTERALARSGVDWPDLEPVLAAHRVGLDVPDAWRRLATRPGAGGLRLVAAAWQVSGRTGQGLAAALRRVAADLRAAEASRRVVVSELASARATGRLVAGLPVVAWLMGSGSGQHPVSWLLAGPAGWACLVLGGGLLLLGLAWIEQLARSAAAP